MVGTKKKVADRIEEDREERIEEKRGIRKRRTEKRGDDWIGEERAAADVEKEYDSDE